MPGIYVFTGILIVSFSIVRAERDDRRVRTVGLCYRSECPPRRLRQGKELEPAALAAAAVVSIFGARE